MIYHTSTALVALASLTQAASINRRAEPKCTDFLIPVQASSSQMIPANNIPANLGDSAVLVAYLTSQAESVLAGVLGGVATVEQSGSFAMSAR